MKPFWKHPVYHTFTFWFCLGGCLFDAVGVTFCLGHEGLRAMSLGFLLAGACFFFGAWSHWYLEKVHRSK